MGLIQKIKLIFKVRKPASKVVNQLKTIKRGYKTWEFWLTLIMGLSAVVASLNGLIPPEVGVIATVGLATLYNIIRGFKKASEDGARPPLKTTEFWVGIIGIVQAGLLEIQGKGIDAEWLTGGLVILAGVMSIFQNLGAAQPDDEIQ